MTKQFDRTKLLLGEEGMKKLASSRVIVFGVGGVGGYVAEALVRSGIGSIDIVDNDKVSLTNLNRQILALHSTVGRDKVDVAAERFRDINPDCKITAHKVFFLPETSAQFDFRNYDYIIDCIDTVKGKLEIIKKASEAGVKVISSMGAGNKLDPSLFRIADITKTSVCPLARVMRRELKKLGIRHLKCVYSTETPLVSQGDESSEMKGNGIAPGSIAFVPSVAGLLIASEVIRVLSASSMSLPDLHLCHCRT